MQFRVLTLTIEQIVETTGLPIADDKTPRIVSNNIRDLILDLQWLLYDARHPRPGRHTTAILWLMRQDRTTINKGGDS